LLNLETYFKKTFEGKKFNRLTNEKLWNVLLENILSALKWTEGVFITHVVHVAPELKQMTVWSKSTKRSFNFSWQSEKSMLTNCNAMVTSRAY